MQPAQLARALALLTALTTACGGNYDPPSLIEPDKLRVLGVRAEPAAITMSAETTLTVLEAGAPDGTSLCYAWAYCPYTWTNNGAASARNRGSMPCVARRVPRLREGRTRGHYSSSSSLPTPSRRGTVCGSQVIVARTASKKAVRDPSPGVPS